MGKLSKRQTLFLEKLKENKGNVSKTCEQTNLSRASHYKWCNENPTYKEAAEEIIEYCIDYVESKLNECIDNLDVASIIFFLKTRGKKRGYVEKTEMEATITDLRVEYSDD